MRPRDPSWSRAILKGSGAPKYGRTTAAHAAAEAAEAAALDAAADAGEDEPSAEELAELEAEVQGNRDEIEANEAVIQALRDALASGR